MADLELCENLINKRRKNIVNHLDDFLLKDISKIVSEYDYYIEGKSYTFMGHTDLITRMILLPDSRIVTGSYDSTLRIWNPHNGNCDMIYTGHSDHIYCLLSLPDECIASGSIDGKIKIWNTQTGNCDITCTDTDEIGIIQCICSLPDGRFVSESTEIDKFIKIWNPSTGKCDMSFEKLNVNCNVNFIDILPSGKIIIGSNDSRIIIWDLATGNCDAEFIGINNSSCAVILSNERIVTDTYVYDDTLRIWNLKTGECEMTFIGHTNSITCIKVLSDERIISSSRDHTCKIWNQKTGFCDLTFSEHLNAVMCVSELPDGRIISASDDDTLKIWNPQTGTSSRSSGQRSNPEGKCDITLTGYEDGLVGDIIILPDGRIVALSNNNTIKIWS
jgi:WD40 repeat protein